MIEISRMSESPLKPSQLLVAVTYLLSVNNTCLFGKSHTSNLVNATNIVTSLSKALQALIESEQDRNDLSLHELTTCQLSLLLILANQPVYVINRNLLRTSVNSKYVDSGLSIGDLTELGVYDETIELVNYRFCINYDNPHIKDTLEATLTTFCEQITALDFGSIYNGSDTSPIVNSVDGENRTNADLWIYGNKKAFASNYQALQKLSQTKKYHAIISEDMAKIMETSLQKQKGWFSNIECSKSEREEDVYYLLDKAIFAIENNFTSDKGSSSDSFPQSKLQRLN